ncbi:hypothetical protein KCV01_g24772, partial [Aureobasidium melanogenum]
MLLTCFLFLVSAGAIYFACEYFVNGVEWFGRKLNLGATATGTVLAAFGTALPESAVTFVAVMFGRTPEAKDIGVGAALGGPLNRPDTRVRVDNRKDLLHPGELVETRIAIGKDTRQLSVPAEAIVLLQNQPTVFVRKTKDGPFEAAPVETGETRDGWTAIRQGLGVGATYVRKGAFALKARILRSQLGEE